MNFHSTFFDFDAINSEILQNQMDKANILGYGDQILTFQQKSKQTAEKPPIVEDRESSNTSNKSKGKYGSLNHYFKKKAKKSQSVKKVEFVTESVMQ